MSQDIFRLFVYGSLRSGFNHPAHNYVSSYFTLEGEAAVKGKLYSIGEYPGAIPSDEDHFIVGELYRIRLIKLWNRAIEQLDDYESVRVIRRDEQPLFRRETVTVYRNNITADAWIYWFNKEVAGRPFIESGDFLKK